ncbi:hypothetical protein KSP40_PGU006145 [Platanthera guangdongensis]|uniref:Uncharacterized protein n=1 Tax=Platanthera guangdongensis TaxID=2320717 RepID=A0ABR2MNG6_9ASPA
MPTRIMYRVALKVLGLIDWRRKKVIHSKEISPPFEFQMPTLARRKVGIETLEKLLSNMQEILKLLKKGLNAYCWSMRSKSFRPDPNRSEAEQAIIHGELKKQKNLKAQAYTLLSVTCDALVEESKRSLKVRVEKSGNLGKPTISVRGVQYNERSSSIFKVYPSLYAYLYSSISKRCSVMVKR